MAWPPKCPHCDQPVGTLDQYPFMLEDGTKVIFLVCTNCEKTISIGALQPLFHVRILPTAAAQDRRIAQKDNSSITRNS